MNQTTTIQQASAETAETIEPSTSAEWWDNTPIIEGFEEASRAAIKNPPCTNCMSTFGQWRGFRSSAKSGVTHRRQCNTCAKWFARPTR